MGPHAVAVCRAAATIGLMPRLVADCLQVPTHRGPVPIVTERFVAAAHRAHLPVYVWTINDEPTIERLLDLGVDGIMTDRLRLLLNVLRRWRQATTETGMRGSRQPVQAGDRWDRRCVLLERLGIQPAPAACSCAV